jgi:cobalt-zinc-cadmium efflux system outer membrane protein
VVQLALRNSPAVRAAGKSVEAAEGRVLQAGRIPNPTFAVAWNESPSLLKPGEAIERDVRLSQPIEFPTKRGSRVDLASADAGIQRLQLDRTILLVKTAAAQAYFALLFSQKLKAHVDEQSVLAKDLERLVAARYRAGTGSYLDLVRARIEVARLGNDAVDALRELDAHRRELLLLIGDDGDRAGTLTDDFPAVSAIGTIDSVAHSLVARSMLLTIARETEQREQLGVAVARSAFLPDFEIGIAHQRRAGAVHLWGIEIQASLPLWFWQDPKGQAQEAAARHDIAMLERVALDRRVQAAVRDALGALVAALNQLGTFDRSLLSDAREIVSTSLRHYESNQADLLTLLDVFRTFRATQVEHLRVQYHHARALVALQAAAELPPDGVLATGDSR